MSEKLEEGNNWIDYGYTVIDRSPVGTPNKIWRCFVINGKHGKMVLIRQYFVTEAENEKVIASRPLKQYILLPYNREKVKETLRGFTELLKKAFNETDRQEEQKRFNYTTLDRLIKGENTR